MSTIRYKNFLWIIIGLLTFFIMQLQTYAAVMSKDEVIRDFVSAGVAYKDKDYDKAISLYNKIINSGWESGAIYYNLANSYFRKGDIGRAILNYERARRLIPADSDLNYNLRYARSLVAMKIHTPKYNLIHRFIKKISNRYSRDFFAWLMIISILIMSIYVLIASYFKFLHKNIYLIVFVFFLLFSLCLYIFTYKLNVENKLAVVLKKTDARFEPRLDSTVHFKLYPGLELKVLKQEGRWAKISREDGKRGWIPKDCFEQVVVH